MSLPSRQYGQFYPPCKEAFHITTMYRFNHREMERDMSFVLLAKVLGRKTNARLGYDNT